MATKQTTLEVPPETQFDLRLLEKKVEHGFLTSDEVEKFLQSLPEEKDFEFTEAEVLDADLGDPIDED